jgi:hypothetical protein
MWATIALIAQLILLVFTFILIGITGNFVSVYGNYGSNYGIYGSVYGIYNSGYSGLQIVQAELAFGILLMFSGLVYIGIYIFVTYVALWVPFHTIDTGHLFHE